MQITCSKGNGKCDKNRACEILVRRCNPKVLHKVPRKLDALYDKVPLWKYDRVP